MIEYAPKWIWFNCGDSDYNHIKFIATMIIKLEAMCTHDDIHESLKLLFTNSMDYCVSETTTETEHRITSAPKSDEFYEVLFEWKLMEFYIDRGYRIKLNIPNFSNSKKAEFYVSDDNSGFYVEAKSINSTNVDNITRPKLESPADAGVRQTTTFQEKKIRDIFKKQVYKAKKKFVGIPENHAIFINVPYPLGIHGKRLTKYINSWLPSKDHHDNLLYIGIFTTYNIYLYDVKQNNLETIKRKIHTI